MSIANINGNQVQTRYKPVLIIDLSPVGLRFLTDLYFPVTQQITLKFQLLIRSLDVELEGTLIWRKQAENQYEYGVKLFTLPYRQILITGLLNRLILENHPKEHFIHQFYRSCSYRSLKSVYWQINDLM